ncbi:hypothetical protein QFZ28_003085 [Neobacillus niacini]|uniref:hypothetical protein n=1 Tax=Neobacillus niacini TaxID=86668 RepID=UPI002785F2E3|nr:hypothetical protein [Neobacillus niacini]MDQ1002685.1 hypothetical protein [Neobacillus niacini]
MIRTAFLIHGYFNLSRGTIVFASQKINKATYEPLKNAVKLLNKIFKVFQLEFTFILYGNQEFKDNVFEPVVNLSSSVAATLETTLSEQINQVPRQDEDYTLSAKQIEYALSLIEKVKGEFELAIEPSNLTIKDLNRLIAYNRYKNKGTLINLVKKGVLRKKNKFASNSYTIL